MLWTFSPWNRIQNCCRRARRTKPIAWLSPADNTRGISPALVIDLGDVEYMDSSGVGTLVHAYRLIKGYGGRMMLARMKPRVRSVFEISRLDRYFQIYETVEEAVSS